MSPETLFQIAFVVIAASVLAVLVGGGVLWIRWFRGHRQFNLVGESGGQLITEQPQPVPRWSVFDFLLLFGLMIVTASLLHQWLAGQEGELATISRSEQLQIHFAANLIALLCTLGYLRLVHQADLRHLTLIPTRRDVRRGLIATVWILSPVLLINIIVSSLVEYEHTVTDLLAEQNRLSTFAFLFVSATILTPIVEEFQFRLLLQGGLQKIADFGLAAVPRADRDDAVWRPTALWPVIVTSLVFGLMHWGQGAAPIPLFFLSIGLGMVYQRTGRLFPAIVIHMLLNGTTLLMEFCRLNAGLDAI